MNIASKRSKLFVTTTLEIILALGGSATVAHAQATTDRSGQDQAVQEIVVTGSRIRRSSDTSAPAPVAVVSPQSIEDKGFVQAGDALNEMTSMSASRAATPALSNGQALPGQDFPNLFNLGPARTLTLFNGRRMTSSASGLGDEAVDENIIPTGLLERIDVVQGGGASVYGSGAIAGVVNYVMKDHFNGLTLQVQSGIDSRKSYDAQVMRATVGRDFAGGRGNIAAEFDYSENSRLMLDGRPGRGALAFGIPNQTPGAGTNGIPRTIYYTDPVAIYSDINGLIVTNQTGQTAASVVQTNNRGFTIDGSGNVVLKSLGTPIPGVPTQAINSELNWPIPQRLNPLIPTVERKIANVLGHYDITDNIKVVGEFLGARVRSTQPNASTVSHQFIGIYTPTFPGEAPIPFDRTNAYLTPASVAQISAANPGFGAGNPLYLAKTFVNLGSKYTDARYQTDSIRGLLALEGKFEAAGRKFFWETSVSHGEVKSTIDGYNINIANFKRAVAAVRNSAGQIVCAVNAPVVTDPGCVPLNIFGTDPVSQPQLAYIMGRSGILNTSGVRSPVTNKQDVVMANLSGDFVPLPGGMSQFSVSYEHRKQTASFNPVTEDLIPQYFTAIAAIPGKGSYNTNEFAAELSVPVLGNDFKLPFVQSLQLDGSYRYVDNSLAGKDSVWGLGLRWDVGAGLVIRGTQSRNFRAPSLNQVLAPPIVTLSATANPCARTNIGSGPSPSVRAANCLALFTANPTFGLLTLPTGQAPTPANRLANFTQTINGGVVTTTQGNPNLENEISTTSTLGFVYQPTFVPGLSISADLLRLDLRDAITLFSASNFASACFDANPQPAELCSTAGYDSQGDYNRGLQSTVNAGSSVLHAEIYTIDYRLPLQTIKATLPGTLDLTFQATHNTYQQTTFAGVTTRTDGTQTLPSWVMRFDTHYSTGPLRINYSVSRLPASKINFTATVENSSGGIYRLKENIRHDISADYRFAEHYLVRVGVNNLTDQLPPFPSTNYGDIIGRYFFTSLKAEF